jgi:hypothetical protein
VESQLPPANEAERFIKVGNSGALIEVSKFLNHSLGSRHVCHDVIPSGFISGAVQLPVSEQDGQPRESVPSGGDRSMQFDPAGRSFIVVRPLKLFPRRPDTSGNVRVGGS